MNKISALILAASLAISPMAAQNATENSNVVQTETSCATSDETVIVVDDSSQADAPSAEANEVNPDDFDSLSDAFAAGFKDGMHNQGKEMDELEEMMIRDHMGYIVGIIAIIFGVPCLAIIAALIVILVYALKRNQRRNEVIRHAIEHNYQLPDSFYTGQKSSQSGSARAPKKFYSAVTLIAIGCSLIVFGIVEETGFFLLIGGIPMLIGIGRMIGYFYVSPK